MEFATTDSQRAIVQQLIDANQSHLFESWKEDPAPNTAQLESFFSQVSTLNTSYPGGLTAYVNRAKKLLLDSKSNVNSFDGWTPSVPTGTNLSDLDSIKEAERTGLPEMKKCCFVLVAGGLGERLGYSGIKVALPVDICTGKSYLQRYIESILSYQNLFDGQQELPLVIMVSEDTKAQTQELLAENHNFGMSDSQITLLCQDKVASFTNNDASIATTSRFEILTKPHGHGDVHMLLHTSGIASKWKAEGRSYVIFFQDTNALVTNTFPSLIGTCIREALDVNSVAVHRKAGDASGGLVRLTNTDSSKSMVINVEYNQLDALLAPTGGDVNDPLTGYSKFPGNINQLALALGPYVDTLEATHGILAEFVNPKYRDPLTRTEFKKPARLECMMQDYPKALNETAASVGYTLYPDWFCYSPCKNNIVDAEKKVQLNVPPQCASVAEHDWYYSSYLKLQYVLQRNEPNKSVVQPLFMTGSSSSSIPVHNAKSARVVWDASFAPSLDILTSRFKGPTDNNIKMSEKSVLIITGEGSVEIHSLSLDGALVLKVPRGCRLVIKSLEVQNAGWEFVPYSGEDEVLAMRGYDLIKHDTKYICLNEENNESLTINE